MKNFKMYSLTLLLTGSIFLNSTAQTIFVDIDASGVQDGSSWANAFTDLQSGIDAAANLVSGGEVWVASGTYKPTTGTDQTISFTLKAGVSIYGGFNGSETLLAQRDVSANATTLSGDLGTQGNIADNTDIIMVANSPVSANEILDGLIFSDGANLGNGSGLHLNGSSPTIRNCIFRNNESLNKGGGILIENSSFPKISNCKFFSNIASQGAAIGIQLNSGGSVEISGCLFYENNTSSMGQGGAIFSSGTLNIYSSTITDNTADFGGGAILNDGGALVLYNSILWGNTSNLFNAHIRTENGGSQVLNDVSIEGGGGSGTNVHNIDPEFVDASNDNYALTPCSPLIDLGNSTNVPSDLTVDLIGTNRITASSVDLGAYEVVAPLMVTAIEPGNPSCFGSTDGQISLNASGGTGVLQYTIDGTNYTTTGIFTGLSSGTHAIDILDPQGCMITTQVTLTDPPVLNVDSSTPTNTSCGPNSGSIAVVASGGSPPYTYSADGTNFQNSSVIENLAAGSYALLVRDANGCESPTAGNATILAQHFAIDMLQTQDLNCFGESTTQTVSLSNGVSPFEYSIDGIAFLPLPSSGEFDIAQGGSHTLEVRDDSGCIVSQTFSLNSPTLLEEDVSSQVNIICHGNSNGEISLTATGGASPYQYRISSPTVGSFQSSGVFTSLEAGDYTINTIDANGCEFDTNFTITSAAEINTGATVTQISCFGGTGAIFINPTGGDGNYEASGSGSSYQPVADFNASRSSVSAGSWFVYVRDGNGCVVMETYTISEPDELEFSPTSSSVTCNGGSDGTITLSGTAGGIAPYEYSIDGTNFQTATTFTNVPAGAFTLVMRDANGCTISSPITVTEPSLIVTSLSATDIACNGAGNGSIDVQASGGTGALEYSIDAINYQTGSIFSDLDPGTYTVSVQDENGCTHSESVTLTEPSPLTQTAAVNDPACNGELGSIQVSASGGSGGYNFTLTASGQTNATGSFPHITAGTYEVRAEDSNGCFLLESYTIVQPSLLEATASNTQTSSCGLADGMLEINATGGVSPYEYALNSGTSQVSNTFSGLVAGVYDVVVIDANQCEYDFTTLISDPVTSTVSTSTTNVLCNGDLAGSISVTVTGGTAPYEYSLDGGTFQSQSNFENLGAAIYNLTVKEANGCQQQVAVTISEPAAISVTTNNSNLTCFNAADGLIEVTASGGTGQLEYSIDGTNYQVGNSFTNLEAGSFTVYVRDENNCGLETGVSLAQPQEVIGTATTIDASCEGSEDGSISIAVSNAIGAVSYRLDGGSAQASNQFNQLNPGTYDVFVNDSNGCELVLSDIIVEAITVITPTLTVEDALCAGTDDGQIHISAMGGSAPYSYKLDNGSFQNGATFTSLGAGIYTITVQDANGCQGVAGATIVEPNALSSSVIDQSMLLCSGAMDGSFSLETTGGISPYQYSIDNGATFQTTGTFSNLSAGEYTVITSDENGCTIENVISFSQPSELTLDASFDGRNVNLTASGGTPPYEYSADGTTFQSSSTFTLANGQYMMTVRDANGCETITSQDVLVTGLNDGLIEMEIFPNPFERTLSIRSQKPISLIRLYNSSGKKVLESEGFKHEKLLNVEALKPGIYLIEISAEAKKSLLKIIKN